MAPQPDDISFPMWPVGVLCAIMASVGFVMGLQLMAKSHKVHPSKLCRYMFFGVLLNVCAALVDSLALAFAAQSLVSALGAVTLFLNTVIAPCFDENEKEILWRRGGLVIKGTVAILLGATLTVISGQKENTAYPIHELLAFYNRAEFLLYELAVGVSVIAFYLSIRCNAQKYHNNKRIMLVFFAVVAGWAGSQQNMLLKSLMELSKSSLHRGTPWISGPFVLMFIVCAVLAVLQLVMVDFALKMAPRETVVFIPLYQAMLLVLGVLTGGFYFGEFHDFAVLQWMLFWGGIVITLLGILILVFLSGLPTNDADGACALFRELVDIFRYGIPDTPAPKTEQQQPFIVHSRASSVANIQRAFEERYRDEDDWDF